MLLSRNLVALVQDSLLGPLDGRVFIVPAWAIISVGHQPLVFNDLVIVGQDRDLGFNAQVPGQIFLDDEIRPTRERRERDLVLQGIVIEL